MQLRSYLREKAQSLPELNLLGSLEQICWHRSEIHANMISLRPEMYLFTNCNSYSACIMVLLLNPFVSFFLHNRVAIGDDL